MTRATTFGARAEDYDRLRPGPHPEALDRVFPATARTVVDLAAGTGLVTRAVLARPDPPAVVAIEPDPRMLARVTGARRVRATAEHLPLAAGSVDAVLASSAWHWFDAAAATSEIARVLRPGGTLGLLWSRADPTVEWVAEVRGVGRAAADGSARLTRRGLEFALPEGHGFTDETLTPVRVAWTRPMTRDEIAGMVCTYSGVLELEPAAQDEVFRAARARLDELVNVAEPIDVPFETVGRRWTRT
ncbi:class I SAM-dependent methyltransferase [Actinomycetospora termitidis]|uniref:Methyltransferase domain-containing protein n=1 Tax=Actinomycetospora termitidis TaxID=3053470 RepID=A0ABT7MB24_9PSEU|nr:class I SAM-dependent methyltransferase [Actinomycetospora sp. Odt1-22]MDL5157868.1 methyltransferase domain-containing protein [Actinomycetospora sp. Odt1-22]